MFATDDWNLYCNVLRNDYSGILSDFQITR